MKNLFLVLKGEWYDMIDSGVKKEEYREIKDYWEKRLLKDFDTVTFSRAYTQTRMTFKCGKIDIGEAVPGWSNNWEGPVFRIQIKDRIS